jgi:uncharacterized SAM-binding protein YcdF (DUF218 family)
LNDLLVGLGIESWKPAIEALLLPPAPFVLMVLVGGGLMRRHRSAGWTLLLAGALGSWLMCTAAIGTALTQLLLQPPAALSEAAVASLKKAPKTAIVVLGGGRKSLAPEYGLSDLNAFGVERLRYGLWLSRQTSLPVAFSGGIGHGGLPGPSEAEIAARVAAAEFGQALRWTESESRDTNENAMRMLPLMRAQGAEHVVLVTHGFHMRRALAAFERAAQRASFPLRVTPAAMGLEPPYRLDLRDWLPSRDGFSKVHIALHEWLGRLAGA